MLDINYDNIAQLSHFKRDLSMKLKNKFIVLNNFSLRKLIDKCQQMNNQIHFLKNNVFYRKFNSNIIIFDIAFNRSIFALVTFLINFVLFAINYDFNNLEFMNFFVVIAILKNYRNMISKQKTHQRQHRLNHDLCLYCDALEHKLIVCIKKLNTRVVQFREVEIALVAFAIFAFAFDSKNA